MQGDLPRGGSQREPEVLPEREAHVWLVRPERVDPGEVQLLSADERRSHAAFLRPEDAQLYLCAHAMLRRVLSRYAPLAPESWRFRKLEQGRPELDHPGLDLRFNLSHTPGLAACIVARHADVGVDVERHRAKRDWMGIAKRFFSPAEQADLRALPEGERMRRFYAVWSLKEAYIKARGLGLALPLEQFSLRFGDELCLACEPALGDSATWQVATSEPTAEHSLSWAIRVEPGERFRVRVRWFDP